MQVTQFHTLVCLFVCLFVYRHGLTEPSLAVSSLCKLDDADPNVLMLLPPLPASGIIGVCMTPQQTCRFFSSE